MSQNPSPPMPFIWGYVTAMLAAAATIASIAVPPAFSTSRPAKAAARWGALNAPLNPNAVLSNLFTSK